MGSGIYIAYKAAGALEGIRHDKNSIWHNTEVVCVVCVVWRAQNGSTTNKRTTREQHVRVGSGTPGMRQVPPQVGGPWWGGKRGMGNEPNYRGQSSVTGLKAYFCVRNNTNNGEQVGFLPKCQPTK